MTNEEITKPEIKRPEKLSDLEIGDVVEFEGRASQVSSLRYGEINFLYRGNNPKNGSIIRTTVNTRYLNIEDGKIVLSDSESTSGLEFSAKSRSYNRLDLELKAVGIRT